MFLPPPQAVIAKFVAVSTDGLPGCDAVAASLWRASLRVIAALGRGRCSSASCSASPSASSETARGIFEPILEFYRPIPPLAYLPLVIIWFGIGEFAKVLVIFLGILPSIIIATNEGLRSVAPDRINAARSLGATRSSWSRSCFCRTRCRAS